MSVTSFQVQESSCSTVDQRGSPLKYSHGHCLCRLHWRLVGFEQSWETKLSCLEAKLHPTLRKPPGLLLLLACVLISWFQERGWKCEVQHAKGAAQLCRASPWVPVPLLRSPNPIIPGICNLDPETARSTHQSRDQDRHSHEA